MKESLNSRPDQKVRFLFYFIVFKKRKNILFCCSGFVFADEYLFSVCLLVNLSSSVKRNNLHRQLGLDSHSEFFIPGFIELMGAVSQAHSGMCVLLQFLRRDPLSAVTRQPLSYSYI